ncbi:gag-pol polyprotein [Tanacetum coccineum]
MMTTEYCPATEIQRMEQELWTLTLKGDDIEAYNNRFHELVLMCPEGSAKALSIGDSIKEVKSPAIGKLSITSSKTRSRSAMVYVAAPAKGRGYAGNLPWCNRCKAHHQPGPCPPRCGKCHKFGHQEGECRTRIPVAGGNSLQNVTCFGCRNQGYYRSDCPELKNRN